MRQVEQVGSEPRIKRQEWLPPGERIGRDWNGGGGRRLFRGRRGAVARPRGAGGATPASSTGRGQRRTPGRAACRSRRGSATPAPGPAVRAPPPAAVGGKAPAPSAAGPGRP